MGAAGGELANQQACPVVLHYVGESSRVERDHRRLAELRLDGNETETFVDRGFSAYTGENSDRGDLKAIMDLARTGRIKRGMGNAPSHDPALAEERTYILGVSTVGAALREDLLGLRWWRDSP